MEDLLIEKDYEFVNATGASNPKNPQIEYVTIYSVKRLSDGQVISIEDDTQFGFIEALKVDGNTVVAIINGCSHVKPISEIDILPDENNQPMYYKKVKRRTGDLLISLTSLIDVEMYNRIRKSKKHLNESYPLNDEQISLIKLTTEAVNKMYKAL